MSRTKQEPKRAGFTFGELKMFFLVAKINLGIEEVGKKFPYSFRLDLVPRTAQQVLGQG